MSGPVNPHLSAVTAGGGADHVAVAWDQGNDRWWDWYLSLADQEPDAAPLVAGPSWDPGPLPDDDRVRAELATPYDLAPAAITAFATDGYVKLPGVFSPGTAARLRQRLVALLDAASDRPGGFRSLEMMWLTDPLVRSAVLSPRVGQISAALLGVDAVRLYHDNALSKEPGGGRTPWHHDRHHFPLATDLAVTAWAALQPIPAAMGPLAFARGSTAWAHVEDLAFDKHGTSFDRAVAERFRAAGVGVDDSPFALGEVSFHGAPCFHTAGANRTTVARVALATTYFADGTRLVDAPTMVSGDWQQFVPGVAPGGLVAGDHNPVVG